MDPTLAVIRTVDKDEDADSAAPAAAEDGDDGAASCEDSLLRTPLTEPVSSSVSVDMAEENDRLQEGGELNDIIFFASQSQTERRRPQSSEL